MDVVLAPIREAIKKWPTWSLPTRLGLILSIIGIPLGLVGVLQWSISAWEQHRQNRDWAPARMAVLRGVGETYSTLFYCARAIVTPEDDILETDTPSLIHYENDEVMLGYSKRALEQLQEAIKLNNASLDAALLPRITTFARDADQLYGLLAYFAEFPNPRWQNWDFVSEGPSQLLATVTSEIEEMHSLYPDSLVRGQDLAGNLLTVRELNALWIRFALNSHRLFLQPQKYTWKSGVEPIVFNRTNLRNIRVPAEDKRLIYLFDGYR